MLKTVQLRITARFTVPLLTSFHPNFFVKGSRPKTQKLRKPAGRYMKFFLRLLYVKNESKLDLLKALFFFNYIKI